MATSDRAKELALQRQIEQIFWKADTDRSGTISKEKLYNMLVQNGYKLSWDQFQKHFASFDTNKNNEINYDGYLRGMGRPKEEWKKFEVYRRMFKKYDRRGVGYFTPEELSAVFHEIGIHITVRELDVLFQSIDVDKSGRIEYDEFLRFFFNIKVGL